MKKKIGLIINPIAGLGGRAGLKGSDTPEIVEKALNLGVVPEAPRRAIEVIQGVIQVLQDEVEFITAPSEMGENEVKICGFSPKVVGEITTGHTSAEDTESIAREMKLLNVDILVFVGGDGTARNIYNAVGDTITVLGIPAGVKMQSAVFAINTKIGAELIIRYLRNDRISTQKNEVVDINEDEFRKGCVIAKLYGYLETPYVNGYVQGVKTGKLNTDASALSGIAARINEQMLLDKENLYILGPGTTTKAIKEKLNDKFTLLGVDTYYKGKLVKLDVNEMALINLVNIYSKRTKIIVTPIGGQGYIFGRGNQQISSKLINIIGKENIIIVSTLDKIASLRGNPLLVDTGDRLVDASLKGYIRIITGSMTDVVYEVA